MKTAKPELVKGENCIMVFPKNPQKSMATSPQSGHVATAGVSPAPRVLLPGETVDMSHALQGQAKAGGLKQALKTFAGMAKQTAQTVHHVVSGQATPGNPWVREERGALPSGKLRLGRAMNRTSKAAPRQDLALNTVLNDLAHHVTPVAHPHRDAHGSAYDELVKGDAYRFQSKLDAACECYERAIEIDPNYEEAYLSLGKALRELGRAEEGCTVLRQALKINGFNRDIQLELAKCYNESGNPQRAITWYERALKLDPSDNDSRFGLALLVELCGDLTYAATLYEKVLDVDPEFLPAYNNLGSIYLRQGDYTEAESFFRELITRAPEFHRGYLGLAITLDRAGRGKEALFYYRHVLAIKPIGRNNEFIQCRITELTTQGGYGANDNTLLRRVK